MWKLKFVKLPPFIAKPEELGKNAMISCEGKLEIGTSRKRGEDVVHVGT